MNDVQAAAIAKADAMMKPALDLYAQRNVLMHKVCMMPYRDLERLNRILSSLSEGDLRKVAAFAEGLAEWESGESFSGDATDHG